MIARKISEIANWEDRQNFRSIALFLSSYGEDVVGGVHMVDATGLVEECVSILASFEVFQIFGLHVGQTEVLIGAEQVLWGWIPFVLYYISLPI